MWRHTKIVPYVFLAPFLILFSLFFIIPLCYSIYLSLFVTRMGSSHFAGFTNYLLVLHDSGFWEAIGRVTYYGVVQVSVMLFIAILLALLLDSPYVKGKSFFRLVYFLPYAVPGVIAAIMWGFLYSPDLNPLLGAFKLFTGGKSVDLLSSTHLLYSIMNMATWEWTGYNMTIYYAGLTSIPIELYDAAKIDGCSELQVAWHIKLPLLRPMLVMTTVLSIIGSLQLFNEPSILSSLTAVPNDYTPNMDIYNTAFSYGNFNYSAALSLTLALITIIASVLFMYLTRTRETGTLRSIEQ